MIYFSVHLIFITISTETEYTRTPILIPISPPGGAPSGRLFPVPKPMCPNVVKRLDLYYLSAIENTLNSGLVIGTVYSHPSQNLLTPHSCTNWISVGLLLWKGHYSGKKITYFV